MTNLDISIQRDLKDCLREDAHWEALKAFIEEKGHFFLSALASEDPKLVDKMAGHQANLRLCENLVEELREFRPKKLSSE